MKDNFRPSAAQPNPPKDKETFEDIGNTTIIPTSVIQSIRKIH